jgi:hypothetical protein
MAIVVDNLKLEQLFSLPCRGIFRSKNRQGKDVLLPKSLRYAIIIFVSKSEKYILYIHQSGVNVLQIEECNLNA